MTEEQINWPTLVKLVRKQKKLPEWKIRQIVRERQIGQKVGKRFTVYTTDDVDKVVSDN